MINGLMLFYFMHFFIRPGDNVLYAVRLSTFGAADAQSHLMFFSGSDIIIVKTLNKSGAYIVTHCLFQCEYYGKLVTAVPSDTTVRAGRMPGQKQGNIRKNPVAFNVTVAVVYPLEFIHIYKKKIELFVRLYILQPV